MNININKLKARIDEEIYICRAYIRTTKDDYEITRVEEKIKLLDSLLDLVYEAKE